MEARFIFLHALSPLHAGTGQGVGAIDLPIAREKATNIPFVPGSSLKGVLRDGCTDPDVRRKVFGPDANHADEHAGSVQISDLRLLLLPIRSLAGTFAWVTSPYLLHRFLRDAEMVSAVRPPQQAPIAAGREMCVVVAEGCQIVLADNNRQQVILEDLDLNLDTESEKRRQAQVWASWLGQQLFPTNADWQDHLLGRFCIVHDDVLTFLLQTATEVTARIRLKETTKTVDKGALWYEEALPTETILSGLAVATPVQAAKSEAKDVFDTLTKLTTRPLQIGGNATVGRGLCRVRLS